MRDGARLRNGESMDALPSLNRVIRIAGRQCEIRVALEDDFHHFRLVLRHDGQSVTSVDSESPRFPYSLCPAAGLRLREIVGMPLTVDMTAVSRLTNAREQCTHQFDMAALAVTAAARGTLRRCYRLMVEDVREGSPRRARLERDDVQLLDWELEGSIISSPPPFAGRPIGAGFTAWALDALDPEFSEAALVLRRGVHISQGRGLGDMLDELGIPPSTGGCWVQQPQRAALASRQRRSTLDFTGRVEALTRDDDAWLGY